jgi:transcriptional regulator with XRE-family HTH domain
MKNNVFGKKLRELRLEKGLSQQKLGGELGFCNQTVSFWENGSREPDLDTLVQIAHYFEVGLEELLEDKN